MPLLIHAVLRAFGVHGQTMQLARKAHGKIGNVDALDHLTDAFREDLAHLETDQCPEVLFVLTERVADATNNFPSLGGGKHLPLPLHRLATLDERFIIGGGFELHTGDGFPRRGAVGQHHPIGGRGGHNPRILINSETLEDVVHRSTILLIPPLRRKDQVRGEAIPPPEGGQRALP